MLRLYFSREGNLPHLVALMICFVLLFSLLTLRPQSSLAQHRPELQLQAFLGPFGQQAAKAASPEEVTKQFYTWYFGAKFPSPKRSNMATFRKYITQGFMKRATARDVESVLFIDAQDYDEPWAKHFPVSPATLEGQKATVQVALNGKEMK